MRTQLRLLKIPKDMPDTGRRDFVTSTRHRLPGIPCASRRFVISSKRPSTVPVKKVVGALLGGEGPRLSGEEYEKDSKYRSKTRGFDGDP